MDEAEKSSGTLRQKLLQIKIKMKIKIQITLFKKGQTGFFGILKVPGGRGIILIISWARTFGKVITTVLFFWLFSKIMIGRSSFFILARRSQGHYSFTCLIIHLDHH